MNNEQQDLLNEAYENYVKAQPYTPIAGNSVAGIFGKEKLPGEPYYTDEQQHSLLDELVPTKLITITYNDKKGESYE